jgi:hypothetical protein
MRNCDRYAAVGHFTAAVDRSRSVGSLPYLAFALAGLGAASIRFGDAAAAEAADRELMTIAARLHDPALLAIGMEGMAGVALLRGEALHAAELLGTADTVRRRWQRGRDPVAKENVDRVTADARRILGDDAFDAAFKRELEVTDVWHAVEVASP